MSEYIQNVHCVCVSPTLDLYLRDSLKIMPCIYFQGNYNRYKEYNNTVCTSITFFTSVCLLTAYASCNDRNTLKCYAS